MACTPALEICAGACRPQKWRVFKNLLSSRRQVCALPAARPAAAAAFSAQRRCGTFCFPDSGPRALNCTLPHAVEHPFALDQSLAYRRWRERKLARYPRPAPDLIVEVRDPRNLRESEVEEIQRVCVAANMVVYASPLAGVAEKDIPRR